MPPPPFLRDDMSDGNLRQLFQKYIPDCHWQGVETGGIGQGVPDMNGCLAGQEFWIENKLTSGWSVNIEPHQIAWAERRVRAGGRVFLAVRRQAASGPRRGAAIDELWLFRGEQAREVSINGLKGSNYIVYWRGGPARWNWDAIKTILAH